MSDARTSGENEAPLLPGGEPELAGTGPQGAYPDGSPNPGDPVVEELDDTGQSDFEG